ncbi:hypothetical protein CEP54_004287 [Fusarium duplospermum]|uniref:DNA2/NAM7 helicase-like C-terminal domain-containing protein n=1 Tax=Fusarium duplospermum TaxID=1325734 RepID=A0A428QJW6_9HYPO|nr:hypothetical protein CEP54_004287 [Fusarium duplospermum]
MDQVTSILTSELTGLGKNDGKQATVLIMSLYKVQATQYQRSIQQHVDGGVFPPDRVKAKTLDKAQGDEADFAFVDHTAVSHPGFNTEPFRGTLAITRARGFTILLQNRGLFVGCWATPKITPSGID